MKKSFLLSLATPAALLAALTIPAQASFQLTPLGTFETGIFDASAAEIAAFDPETAQVFVTNANSNTIDVLDISNPVNPALVNSIDLGDGDINSVAFFDGVLAAAVAADDALAPGAVQFFDAAGNALGSVEVGVGPDQLTFTPDGTRILVANEGEPEDNLFPGFNDPDGSVSIIDLSGGVASATVETATFDGVPLTGENLRIFPGVAPETDFEPEFITVTEDSQVAFVALQENNALGVLDLTTGQFTEVIGLGSRTFSTEGSGLDPSAADGGINIQTFDNLSGLFLPDAIATFTVNGQTFVATANEGDSRDADETVVAELVLDPTVFSNAEELQSPELLGDLEVSNIDGDIDGDGDFDELFTFGSRSFSIFDDEGSLVFDSGDLFEQITAELFPENFNADNDSNDLDGRSADAGPEPEGLTLGTVGDSLLAFVGLERIGGIATFDITDPFNVSFEGLFNNRNFDVEPSAESVLDGTVGDLGPEGLLFISDTSSPNGSPLLVVTNEVSGSTTIFQVEEDAADVPEPAFILGLLGLGALGVWNRQRRQA